MVEVRVVKSAAPCYKGLLVRGDNCRRGRKIRLSGDAAFLPAITGNAGIPFHW